MFGTRIVSWPEIEQALLHVDLVAAMERAFAAYSAGGAVVPPVGELLFGHPRGEAHIKYGYLTGDSSFLVKIATGFYSNPDSGLPPFSGVMLLFSSRTGLLDAILLDEGRLTNARTAAAGAVAAKWLGPERVFRIGIVGSGVQARLQLMHLRAVCDCIDVIVWGRSSERTNEYAAEMRRAGFRVDVAQSPAAVAASSNLIVTTTSSETPLLMASDIVAGTHITAVGSDTPDKCELDPALLARADLIAVDSIAQSRTRGEANRAIDDSRIDESSLVELGQIVAGISRGREDSEQITIADLTGIAVQDIEAAKSVMAALEPLQTGGTCR